MTSEKNEDKWNQLEQAMRGVYAHIKARADGHELSLVKAVHGDRLVAWVYVNGLIKGEWYRAENGKPVHPEARFWCPHRSRVYPLSKYNALKKAFGKSRADQMTALVTVCFTPMWTSPRSLIRHLKKNFPDLEILEATHV